MTPSRRWRFLFLEQCLGAAAVNFVINGVIAWLIFGERTRVSLWGTMSVAGDTVATAFLLPFITALIVTPLTRRAVARGRVAGLPHAARPGLTGRVRAAWLRGLLLGLAALAALSPALLLVLAAPPGAGLPLDRFLLFKAGFAAALAALVTPLIARWALADRPRSDDRSPRTT